MDERSRDRTFWPNSMRAWKVSGEVFGPRTTSNNFITGTGLKKCKPVHVFVCASVCMCVCVCVYLCVCVCVCVRACVCVCIGKERSDLRLWT
jgi:hypothetical protein